jgi:hypothetical protein
VLHIGPTAGVGSSRWVFIPSPEAVAYQDGRQPVGGRPVAELAEGVEPPAAGLAARGDAAGGKWETVPDTSEGLVCLFQADIERELLASLVSPGPR